VYKKGFHLAEQEKKPLVIHPFLLGVYPLVALISINADQIQANEIWRSFGWVLSATLLLILLVYLLVRNWGRAGLVCTLMLVLFFSWGHIFRLIEAKYIAGVLVGRADFLLAAWSTIWILVTWWIIRKMTANGVENATKLLNIVSVIALVFPVIQIVNFTLQTARVSEGIAEEIFEPIALPATKPEDLPDIYYIVVDGYGRADVLQELYEYDNSEFIDFLGESGFYVAGKSHSNYGQTTLSLSSTLNLTYIDELAEELKAGSTSRAPLAKVIRRSRLREVLSQSGYQIVALASGYNVTEFVDADWYLKEGNALNNFETMWLTNSAAAVVIDIIHPIWYRNRVLTNLDTLAHMPDTGSPRFVFAHILLPHPPFVFSAEGESIPPRSFREGNYYDGTIEEYIEGYRCQLTFLNMKLTSAISGIIEESEPKPIIILQGDHGPGAYLNWDVMEENCFRERMSILNAYYLPEAPEDQLYDSISPVNSFRLVLDTYFQTELGLLDDRSYFSLWNSLYQLEDITDQLNSCNL
jgi:hypothetical protein